MQGALWKLRERIDGLHPRQLRSRRPAPSDVPCVTPSRDFVRELDGLPATRLAELMRPCRLGMPRASFCALQVTGPLCFTSIRGSNTVRQPMIWAGGSLQGPRQDCNGKRFCLKPTFIASACQSRRSRASATQRRAGADAQSSDLDPRSFPSIARSSRGCAPPRIAW